MEKSAARLTSNKFRTVVGSDHGGDSIEGADQSGGQFLSEGLERERCILHHIRLGHWQGRYYGYKNQLAFKIPVA